MPATLVTVFALGDWDGLDPMSELAKLRHLKVDDWKTQHRKEREWQKALEELEWTRKNSRAINK